MTLMEYKLKEDEVEETLLCLAWKREGQFKKVNLLILNFIAVILLLKYAMNTEKVYLLLLDIQIIFIIFIILYGFDFFRRKRARKIVSNKGIYKIGISNNGLIYEDLKEKYNLEKCKGEVFISENVISIKINGGVYCIPKRSVKIAELDNLISILKDKCVVRSIKTGMGSNNEK